MMEIETNELTIDQLNCVHGAGQLSEITLSQALWQLYQRKHPGQFPACKDRACAQ